MDNKSYIAKQYKKGNKVYIIDDWDERALCFDPKYPGKVYAKSKNSCTLIQCESSNPSIFKSTLSGEIVTEQEFLAY